MKKGAKVVATTSGMRFVITQVVGWENPNPTTKMATTKGHYTQCHLDIGPALQGWLGHSREVISMTLGGIQMDGRERRNVSP